MMGDCGLAASDVDLFFLKLRLFSRSFFGADGPPSGGGAGAGAGFGTVPARSARRRFVSV